jgi:hypothetical protein
MNIMNLIWSISSVGLGRIGVIGPVFKGDERGGSKTTSSAYGVDKSV